MDQRLEQLLTEAFLLGFMCTREGFNAECAYVHCCDGLKPDHETEGEFRAACTQNEAFMRMRAEAMLRLGLLAANSREDP